MKNVITKLSLSLFLALSLSAKETYTIDDLIVTAMQNSPELKISASRYEASKQNLIVADSGYLPVVDLSVSAGQFGQSDIQNDKPDDMVDSTGIVGTVSLKQLIYDFGKTTDNSDIYKFDSESFDMANEQKISDKKMEVKSAYYNVLQRKALIDVNKENVKLNKAQLYRSQKYFEAGIRTKIDVSDAKVEFIKSKLDLRKSEYDLKLAFAYLDQVVGFTDAETDYDVFTQELDLTDLYSSLSVYGLNLINSIEFAYQNRYEIKQYIAKAKAAKASSKQSTSEFYPSIFLYGDYTKQDIQDEPLKDNMPEDKWTAAVNFKWNLYEGGATSAIEQEKKIQQDISDSELLFSKLSIKKDTTQAYINVDKMKDSVELSQSLLKVSNEKFDQASKRYEHGLSDYIELQQSRQGYIDAKASLVIEYYNYYNAIAILDNAIGK